VVTAGTAENTSLKAKLDYVAVQINAMKTANVPVILAIYHETQTNGWFWWAETTTGSAFVNLWTYTFNYLTNTKGLTNIVWLMPFSGSPSSAFYPGKAYVDIGGPDEYTQPSNLLTFTASANYNPAANILGSSMPITLHETGTAPQPDSMFPSAAPWVLWNVWASYYSGAQSGFTFNTVASLQQAYASQYTITRDEVPNLK
jgi:beta-mannanase